MPSMHERQLYEYAVIRVVPRVERGEFINVGIVLLCKSKQFLGCKITPDTTKIKYMCNHIDLEEVEQNLQAFRDIVNGVANAGPIARLSPADRFRWLTSARSTIIQTSKVHPGLTESECDDLERLYNQLVR